MFLVKKIWYGPNCVKIAEGHTNVKLIGNQNVIDEMSSEFVLNGSGSCVPLPQHL